MALKDTVKHMRDLLNNIVQDLEKADNGNKAASQRVRTGTVKLEKIAKLYRKESIKSEKTTKGQKKPVKKTAHKAPAHKAAAHKAAAHKAPAHKAPAQKAPAHKAPAKKTAVKPKAKAAARPRALAVKKPTAKLPTRRFR